MECSATAPDPAMILQSAADFTDVYTVFNSHLSPFLSKPLKSSTRTLAKEYLPFLHKSLTIIPKRLSELPKLPRHLACELFRTYQLCLDCLDMIAPELASKPHSVQTQRLRYVHYLERWEMFEEAESEGIMVLEKLGEAVIGCGIVKGKGRKRKTRLVPEFNGECDRELVVAMLEAVVMLVKCAAKRKIRKEEYYRRIISLVNESESWFKVLDANEYEKYHSFLVTNLYIIVLYLVSEVNYFGVDLICKFSVLTFKEYKKSSSQDHMYKVASKICSSLFSQRDMLAEDVILDVLEQVLDFLANECQGGMEGTAPKFLDFVSNCANKCHGASPTLSNHVAKYLNRLAGAFSKDFSAIGSIMRYYVTGLLASSLYNLSNGKDTEKCQSAPARSAILFLSNKELLMHVAASSNLLKSHLDSGCNGRNSVQKVTIGLPYYWEALKFFCLPLAESIYSNRKEIFSEDENTCCFSDLTIILDAFHQYCDIFLQHISATERERETSGENHRVITSVVVAALILSFKTNHNIKEMSLLVKHVISSEWVPVKRLKYLYVSLNNIAVILNRENKLNESIKALKLCCKALWNYVVNLCEMLNKKPRFCQEDLSEKVIADFVVEASEKTAFLLELNKKCTQKTDGIVKESLKCWSIAESMIGTLSTPTSLVKTWVKTEYCLLKDFEAGHGRMLHTLLHSSEDISKRVLQKLLEEELLAYDESSYLDSEYCQRMKLKIIDFLLAEVYVTKDSYLKKSKVLIDRALILGALGLARLDEGTQCLSDAISILKSVYCAKRNCCSQAHHLLVHAYILHALCLQQVASNVVDLSPQSEFLLDIHAALNLFLNPDHGHADQHSEKIEESLYLWYQLIDFLSIKGYLEIHPSLYDVVFKLFDQKYFPLTRTFSQLWKNRRLNHGLCVSPVNPKIIETLSKHRGKLCDSNEFWRKCIDELKPLVVGFNHIDNEIKLAASGLASQVPVTSCSIFLSSNLYYDLSGSLVSSGRIVEALKYAKEAHRLRSKLLRQNFKYSVEKLTQAFDENGEIVEKSYYSIQIFEISNLMVTKGSCNFEGSVLTPWNVLSCYLESILQVGTIQEILGNGSEAEMLLRWGLNVAQFHALPLFEISFSSILGKLYRKQKLWKLAEKELFLAKKLLADNHEILSCKRCVWMHELSIDQQIGDLYLTISSSMMELPSTKTLFDTKSLYRSALNKLNCLTSTGVSFEVASSKDNLSLNYAPHHEANGSVDDGKSEPTILPRRSRRSKKELKPEAQKQDVVSGHNRRVTRSKHRSSGQASEAASSQLKIGCTRTDMSTSSSCYDHLPKAESACNIADLRSDITSLCGNMSCWHRLHVEYVDCKCLNKFIHMNWEIVYRKLSLRLLITIGKFAGTCGNVHEALEILLQSVSVLFCRDSHCMKCSSDSPVFLLGKQFPGESLTTERAALLYYICWFGLKTYTCKGIRDLAFNLSSIGIPKLLFLLKQSFILSREVPLLVQKISRLLAAIYVLSTSDDAFSISPNEEGSESRWASFFHQASLGTHLNHQIFSGIVQNKQSQIDPESEDSLQDATCNVLDAPCSLRLAPESYDDLEKYVLNFFQNLPLTPVICISLIAGDDAILLREILHCSKFSAWILLSHISSDDQHVTLLPVYTNLDDSEGICSSAVFNCKDSMKKWHCPWISSVIDDIAPVFRHVLEGNYYSSSEHFLESIKDNTKLWWKQRSKLDEYLYKLLQDIEDTWLGTWKYLLLGEWPDCDYLMTIQKNLSEHEEQRLQHVISKKCFVSMRLESSSKATSDLENIMQLLLERMLQIPDSDVELEYPSRKAIILVLDFELQMLPWESLPILRKQEVYRMPSVGSVLATLERCHRKNQGPFPLIDPLDSYYLLNPDGDLSRTQAEFETWFKDQHMEGKIGTVPAIEELTLALKNHDLFIYFGHGSGTQYIPGHEIQKLDSCAATLLLGCSSGSLYLKGSYVPHGAPISYLLGGSPVIIANLWEVTDKDIDRFGKALLDAWLGERSSFECSKCSNSPVNSCHNKPRIGSFMGKARDACTLGYLIGAAPVCYGVPTGIIMKKPKNI